MPERNSGFQVYRVYLWTCHNLGGRAFVYVEVSVGNRIYFPRKKAFMVIPGDNTMDFSDSTMDTNVSLNVNI
ncbi:hypothetical protein CEXT_441351 [Caerostris extrusa]|uniref:Uncharacterized protein n=1 Tax=Caerostris extrusa TaxID=172846 RepID=A0AAV4ULT5_CAEEX|nr:hypothetical protein CEXT_441351 [Caerostris extrusa]